MPNQSITFRLEFVHRNSSVLYFAGQGGVTSQTGYSTTPIDPNWRPDLVKSESRFIVAMLFRLKGRLWKRIAKKNPNWILNENN